MQGRKMKSKKNTKVIHMKSKPRIVVGINSLVSTVHLAYSNHIQLFFRLGRNYPQYDFILNNPARMGIDRMRNMSAEVALDSGAEYVLMLDDDVIAPFNCLTGLLAANADIVAGDVMIRGYPFNHMLFKWTDKRKLGLKPMSRVPEPRGLIDVGAVGCSLTLIKTSVFRQTPPPYFVTGPSTNTEDVYFCVKADKAIPNLKVKADTRIICQHILWEESIGSNNRKFYKQYYEKQYPEVLVAQKKKDGDRGVDYLAMVQGVVGGALGA